MSAPPPDPEMTAVVRAASCGDRRATERLILRYRERIARFAIAQTGNEANYEDLCQTVFVKMALGLPRLKAVEAFEPWLFRIAQNVCRDHLRARRGWRRLFVAYTPSHDSVPAPEADPDAACAIDGLIGKLPAAQRDILRLSLERRRSYAELAVLSRSSVSAVKSRLRRARENLRAMAPTGDRE